jgi:hypothetical protein
MHARKKDNENCNRDQATTKDGQQCFNTCYPKKGTHAIAKPRTPPPSLQKNKVFIFIAVLHLGETGSLTKLNLSKGMNFTLQYFFFKLI